MIQQAQASRSEFEHLLQRYRRTAFDLAYRLTRNAEDAEDLTQDALVRAWRGFDSYDRRRPFRAWILRIVSNLAVDRWRRRASARTLQLDQRCPSQPANITLGSVLPDSAPGPEEQCLRSVLSQQVRRAIGTLPEPYRTAIVLADIEQRSYRDVAQTMRCALGTVRSRVHRGRVALRERLASASMGLMD